MRIVSFLAGLLLLLSSCTRDNRNLPGNVPGFRPVYSSDTTLHTISNKPARKVVRAGKIYVKGNYLFQNEIGEGIHIIDNTNPATAERVAFIRIAGSGEIAIRGNFLYSNNFDDLVVIDISDIRNVREVRRIKNAFHQNNFQLAPPSRGYFECVDKSRGTVIAWVADTLTNPSCIK